MSPPERDRDRERNLAWRMRHSLHRSIPAREELASHPLLRPVASHLLSPRLWHLQHEAVARGVAIGLFWAFLMPVAHLPMVVAHCVWWRANLPLAIAATLVTTPLTLGFWLWAAYWVGRLFVDAPPLVMPGAGTSLLEWAEAVGRPALVGMALFAVVGSACAYLGIRLTWRAVVAWRWRTRPARRKARQSAP